MKEAEWLAGNDPAQMLRFILQTASDRKLRLTACACCRSEWDELSDRRSRLAVEIGERFADGDATGSERRDAWAEAKAVVDEFHVRKDSRAARLAEIARSCVTGPIIREAGSEHFPPAAHPAIAVLLHDVFGNPFRPVKPDPGWRSSAVVALADQMYAGRDFSALPSLADALAERGCGDPHLLAHCRGPGPHVRGCWVVDLILGKE
jgi:hypothetical protein